MAGTGTQNDPYDGSTSFAAAKSVTLTNVGLVANATTGAPHGYSSNQPVTIDVQTNPVGWSGTFLVTVTSSTTFTYLMINAPTGTPSGVMNASAVLGFRFDTIMTTLAANTRIHLGPTSANRPFLTKGYKVEGALGLSVKPAMKIIGSGIDVTTLCLVGQPGTCYAIGHDFAAGTVDYFEVSDLTIDSNLMIPVATGNTACGAVRVMGNHARVRRIKVINWGANAAVPLFVVSAITADSASSYVGVVDCGIEEVIAVLPVSSASVALITVLHAGPSDDAASTTNEGYGTGPFIRNCFVDCGSPTATPEYRGLSMAWCKAGIVEGNQVHNTKYGGPYIKYSSSRDLVVRNNFYKNVAKGPFWNLGNKSSNTKTLSTLTFALITGGYEATATTSANHNLNVGDRVQILCNPSSLNGTFVVSAVTSSTVFKYKTSVNGTFTSGTAERVFGIAKLVVEGNTIELATLTSAPPNAPIGIHLDDNALSSQAPDYAHGDVIIRDNKIRYLDGQFDSSYSGYGIQINGAKNLLVRNNVVECYPSNPLRNNRCGSVKYFNDKTPAGVLIQGINEGNRVAMTDTRSVTRGRANGPDNVECLWL